MNADQRLAWPRFGQLGLGDLQDRGSTGLGETDGRGVRHRGSWLVDGDRRAGTYARHHGRRRCRRTQHRAHRLHGVGEVVAGAALAAVLGRRFVETDAVIVERYGPIPAIFAEHGEAAFRTYERELADELPMKRRWSSRPEAACSSTRQSPSGSNPADGCSASRHHPHDHRPGPGRWHRRSAPPRHR